jgi:hypothetical protein
MVDATGDSDVEKLRREAEELRALMRALSARLAVLVASLPRDMAVALARGESEGTGGPFRLTEWHETIEVTRADIAPEMDLLWKRVPPRESA